ncbi:hypothetical protein VTK73DRAFT_899 [Phialemonium thermophilum]|uniref:EXPERA domain-containing protein n=1 Tax=Phialemonium thermophilum TaxID=223376 RepID=A0ABR3Y3F7_9PEZI
MCIGHLYGVALYYGTCYFEYHHHAISHSRPEFLYYWVYYVGLNLPWALVPFYLLFHRVKEVMAISKAFKRVDSLLEKRAKAGDGIRQSKKRQ